MPKSALKRRLRSQPLSREKTEPRLKNTSLFDIVDEETINRIRNDLLDVLPREALQAQLVGDKHKAQSKHQVQRALSQIIPKHTPDHQIRERNIIEETLKHDLFGFGPIQPLINDPNITEIMVNGPEHIYIERYGQMILSDITFHGEGQLRRVIERIVALVGRRIDIQSPYVDARLPDGSRVHAIIPPLALSGSTLTIRKFGEGLTVQKLIEFGSMNETIANILNAAVEGALNVVVFGGTGSGKTTLLNALSNFIPASERIITVEDSAELQLEQPHVVSLETKDANTEGQGEVTIRDLIKQTLRMNPDRVVVGECRDGAALDMLQAMNTGHDGSLTTVHANNPEDAVRRLVTLVLMAGEALPADAIQTMISSAVDLLVETQKFRDGSRKIVSVSALRPPDIGDDTLKLDPILEYKQTGQDEQGHLNGLWEITHEFPQVFEKAQWHGADVDREWFHGGEMR